MAVIEIFELLCPEQIALNREENSFDIFLIPSKNKNSNTKSDIEDSNEKEMQNNYNINKNK